MAIVFKDTQELCDIKLTWRSAKLWDWGARLEQWSDKYHWPGVCLLVSVVSLSVSEGAPCWLEPDITYLPGGMQARRPLLGKLAIWGEQRIVSVNALGLLEIYSFNREDWNDTAIIRGGKSRATHGWHWFYDIKGVSKISGLRETYIAWEMDLIRTRILHRTFWKKLMTLKGIVIDSLWLWVFPSDIRIGLLRRFAIDTDSQKSSKGFFDMWKNLSPHFSWSNIRSLLCSFF